MPRAATLSFVEISRLLEHLPSYRTYTTCQEAESAEKTFRQALGRMLKECGDHLLSVTEREPRILTAEQETLIDDLIDRINLIFRRLDREGAVCLVGDCESTIAELEEIDARLLLLVEEALNLVRNLGGRTASARWFATEAVRLSRDLAAFSEAAEERNYLLGLGWESEFYHRWRGRGS
jgi:uncharacterized protein (DUF1810 family)